MSTFTRDGFTARCDGCKVVVAAHWKAMSDHTANHHLLDVQASRKARRDQQKEAS